MAGILHSKSCRLACMLSLTASFCLLELISGYATNSMALIADSFHMLSDVLALLIAFFSVRIAKRKTRKNTFGWARAEVLGAMINSVFLCALCFSILVEAVKRLVAVEPIDDPKQILIVGACGLFVNIIGMLLFHGQASSDHHYHPPARIGEEQNLEQLAADEGLRYESSREFFQPPTYNEADVEEDEDDNEEEVYGKIKNGQKTNKRKLAPSGVNADRSGENKNATSSITADTISTRNGSRPFSSPNMKNSDAVELKTRTADRNNNISNNTDADDSTSLHSDGSRRHRQTSGGGAASAGQLNMRAAFLHVMGDALGSVVVIISALIIWLTEWSWRFYIDPLMSGILVFIIICTTIPVLKESYLILLQTAPKNIIKVDELKRRLQSEFAPHILSVHELHVWQLAGDKVIASAHLLFANLNDYMRIAKRLKKFFHNQGIHSTTLQPEIVAADEISSGNDEEDEAWEEVDDTRYTTHPVSSLQ